MNARQGILATICAGTMAGCGQQPDAEPRRVSEDLFLDVSNGASLVCGTLAIDQYDGIDRISDVPAPVYRTRVARGLNGYTGMEDNDIRGFLDGVYKEGWNQVSQTHLRLGRRGRNPAYGELELFRNLQRWTDLPLPVGAEVVDASITLKLESGPPFPVGVAIYAVRKDWNPGGGGTEGDNNSPPAPGEAWWLAAEHDAAPWSSPGAGHASDSDDKADTWGQPLAVTMYEPGADSALIFSAPSLTRYIAGRVRERSPLLFLYKLLDAHEDSPGSVMEIWSANVGVDGSGWRPTLEIDWSMNAMPAQREIPVRLETGRSLDLSSVPVNNDALLVTDFRASDSPDCNGQPFVEFRITGSGGEWQTVRPGIRVGSGLLDFRITAATDPKPLGGTATLEISDTWVPDGNFDTQTVSWEIVKPNGQTVTVVSTYAGDYTWQSAIELDAPGRWLYRWQHALAGKPVRGPQRGFDVVAREPGQIIASLRSIRNRIENNAIAPRSHEMLPFELDFMRLERAGMAMKTAEIAEELRLTRNAISPRSVPDPLQPIGLRERELSNRNNR